MAVNHDYGQLGVAFEVKLNKIIYEWHLFLM
jgi:hypothetical protein